MHDPAPLGIDIAPGVGPVVRKPRDDVRHDGAIVDRNPSRRRNDLAPALLRAVGLINHHFALRASIAHAACARPILDPILNRKFTPTKTENHLITICRRPNGGQIRLQEVGAGH